MLPEIPLLEKRQKINFPPKRPDLREKIQLKNKEIEEENALIDQKNSEIEKKNQQEKCCKIDQFYSKKSFFCQTLEQPKHY